ncbi:MAG: cell division protein SepF [Clostridia bacterium]
MANFLDKMLNMVGWADQSEIEAQGTSDIPVKSSEKKQTSGKVLSMPRNTYSTMNILSPECFEEARDICACIRANEAVIVNLENIKKDQAQRIVDFISGAVYALDGGIEKISANIFAVTPSTFIVEKKRPGDGARHDFDIEEAPRFAN